MANSLCFWLKPCPWFAIRSNGISEIYSEEETLRSKNNSRVILQKQCPLKVKIYIILKVKLKFYLNKGHIFAVVPHLLGSSPWAPPTHSSECSYTSFLCLSHCGVPAQGSTLEPGLRQVCPLGILEKRAMHRSAPVHTNEEQHLRLYWGKGNFILKHRTFKKQQIWFVCVQDNNSLVIYILAHTYIRRRYFWTIIFYCCFNFKPSSSLRQCWGRYWHHRLLKWHYIAL